MNNLSNKELNIRLIKAFPLLRLNDRQIDGVNYALVKNRADEIYKFDFNYWQDIMPICHSLGIYARPIAGGYYAQEEKLNTSARDTNIHKALALCCIKELESMVDF